MNELKIGWASRDVSTDKPIDIPGQFHMRVSQGVLDPITVNALVIDNGGDIAVFLSADFVSIRPYLLEEVRAKVAGLVPDFPVDRILMSCTHTHPPPAAGMSRPSAASGARGTAPASTAIRCRPRAGRSSLRRPYVC